MRGLRLRVEGREERSEVVKLDGQTQARRISTRMGPYSRTMPRAVWWP